MNEFEEYIEELNKNIKYEITDSLVDGDEAKVVVKFTYSDAKELIGEVLSDYFSEALSMAFSGEEYDQTITIKCVNQDGKWLISEVPDEIVDIASGNIYSALVKFGDSMNEATDSSEQASASDELAEACSD